MFSCKMDASRRIWYERQHLAAETQAQVQLLQLFKPSSTAVAELRCALTACGDLAFWREQLSILAKRKPNLPLDAAVQVGK